MKSKVRYIEKENSLTVEISPKYKGMIVFGMWFFYTMPFLVFLAIMFWSLSTGRMTYSDQNILIGIGVVVISVVLVRVALKKIYEKEILKIDGHSLRMHKKFIILTGQRYFDIRDIKDLRYVGREDFTEHPLATSGFDYLGIGSEEKIIQWLIEGGNLSFYYHGSIYRFGKNLWEEDGHEIIERLKKFGCSST